MDQMTTTDLWSGAVQDVIAAGRRMDRFGWVPATAGNISRRLPDGRIAITRSGGHKGCLTQEGVIEVGMDGKAVHPGDRPSAETLLHCQLYAHDPAIGAVLHGHSVASTVLSMATTDGALTLADYEVQKVFEGQTTHDASVRVPVFDNDQDIARLCTVVAPELGRMPAGYIIRGHGVYVWGATMDVALARLEGLEFLLACELEKRKLRR
ncbi:methylthioribulose 1-phosphate dehydratase [Gluconacetobacter sp. 1b LMG 1731]|uniref:Methylthioribulose-1-phosphate dehydratase n=1 Tax=Gluconacetobacter dulcium TaxID=2729096 RepID=A0A7W4IHE9_9PROT|nr:methylthioribulose 1-phosphate dehydratase [Gluconacetobacter dulcium]MBB2162978.1 methylthioribulose 1-phosphate dehydratase [Gluconacetobacter dulcium]MBB2192327.1 methylthioribulose 1-phosphate dehydratase [Gluconacetobacter dulcium]